MKSFPVLSATFVLLGMSALPADAASVFEATQSLTLTVTQGDDDVAITYLPDAPFVSSLALGDFGTFSGASALGTLSDVSLTLGSSFVLAPKAEGIAANNSVVNTSASEARQSGTLRLENTGQTAAQIVFEILYDMTWLATVDDPATETATAEVLWELLVGNTTLFSKLYKADSLAGLPGGSEANSPNTLALSVELDPFEIEEYTIRATSKGMATTEPSTVPLPAAGWLLVAGLGGLVVAARRKAT